MLEAGSVVFERRLTQFLRPVWKRTLFADTGGGVGALFKRFAVIR